MEEWRAVVGWEGLYEVSSIGRVRSLARNANKVKRRYEGRLLSLIKKRGTGYHCVTLHRAGEEKPLQFAVHRLVLEAFVGQSRGCHACHNNGKRDDNRLENLRWGSAADNAADRAIHGTQLRGEQSPFSKLDAQTVRFIRSSPQKQQELAEQFGVTQVLISQIRLRKAWKHVGP